MGFFSKKLAPDGAEPAVIEPAASSHDNDLDGTNKEIGANSHEKPGNSDGNPLPEVSSKYQAGVRNVEAMTTVWTKWDMIFAYASIWLIYFITSTQEVVVRALNPFVTSSFGSHSLTATVTVMSSLFGGLSKLPMAKLLDTWGRPQTMALATFFWLIGFVMMAACKNVETYAAAQVFSLVGAQGVSYCLTVFIADTSSLLNRPLMLAFATSPYIVTTWIGGPMSESLLDTIGWRWGFGIWSIVIPITVSPLCALFFWNHHKAKKQGLIEKRKPLFTPKRIYDWCIQVDMLGIIILAGGMALFLLPFNIYSLQDDGWKDPMIICMIIFGGLLIITFVFWERFGAPVTFIPYELLADRTVFFAGLMFLFVFFNSSVWGSFFTSMLLICWNTGVTKATYISNIYRVGSCFSALVLAYFMRLTGRFKWVNLYFSLPLMILGVGLMIQFRQPDQNLGYVIMTQIFVAFAGGPTVVSGEMAMMAPSDHQHVAVILAILDLFGSVGSALGATVASAIWTGTFKDRLKVRLPAGADIENIYSSIYSQLAYKPGTPIRHGIALAYGDSQRYMLITSVCLLVIGWACVFMWRDIRVGGIKQTRGNVV
ncbi:Fc.00g084380.m01.CDS01 [Cosmosporella sp. VM-42]